MKEMPQIVVQRLLARQGGAEVHAHPDPNFLSAYGDGLLGAGERLQITEHLARCSDCREVAFVSLPAITADLGQVVSVHGPTWSWSVLRWSAAMACVAIIGCVVALNFREHRRASQQIAANSVPAIAVTPADGTVAAPVASSASPSGLSEASSERKESAKKGVAALANSNDEPVASTATPSSGAVPRSLSGASADQGMRQAFAPESDSLSPALASRMVVATAPLWTLTADGGLQRSLDGGKTWAGILVAPNVHFLAVSALKSEIWVVGECGAVYHSNDAGQSWHQVKPAVAGESLSADVTGVQFVDAAHGSLITGAATWLTDDGGETWRKR
jgi:hypothetical protein